jgi:hypothetical protein
MPPTTGTRVANSSEPAVHTPNRPAKTMSDSVSASNAPAIITWAMRVSSTRRSSRMRDFVASEVTPVAMATKTASHTFPPIRITAPYPIAKGTTKPPIAANRPTREARPTSRGSISRPM